MDIRAELKSAEAGLVVRRQFAGCRKKTLKQHLVNDRHFRKLKIHSYTVGEKRVVWGKARGKD